MDNATRVLLLHHAEGAGTFGVCKRATRDAADELAQASQTLRQCGKGTRARYAAYAARCGAEACRLWSEEPGCAKSLARLGGEIKEMREDPGGHHHRWDDDNDKAVSSDDDYSDPAEPLTMASAERRALAEDLQERIGAGCCHAANAVRVAVVRTGRRAAEAARDRVRHDLHVAAAQCVSRLGSTVSKAPAEEQCAAADAVEALLFPTSNRVDPLSKLALAAEMETELDAKEDSFGAREESGDVVGTESEEEDVVGTEDDDDDNVAPLADATRPGPEIVAEKPVAAPEPVVPPSAVLQAHTRTVFVPAVPATRHVPQHPQSNARGSGALSSDKAPAAAPSIDCSAEKQPRLAQKTASRDCVAGPSRVVGATEAPGAGAGAVAGLDTSCVDASHAMPGQMTILERPTTGDVPTPTPTIDGVAETAPAVSANLNLQKPTQVPPAGPGTSASSEYRRGVAEGFVAGVLTQTWRALDTSFSQAIADAFTESLPSCPAGVMAMLLPLSKALTLCGRNTPREADVPGTQPENSKEALRDSHDTAPSARGTAEPWKEPTDGTPGKTKPVPSPAAMPVWAARAVAAKRRGKNPKNNSPPLALRFVPPPERKGGARAGEFSTDRETPETKATGKQSEKKHRKNQTEAPINTTDQGGKPKPPVTLRAFGVSLDLRPKAPAQSAPFLTPATDQPVTEKRKRVSSGFLSRDDGTSVAPTSSFDGGGGVGVGVGVVSITNPRPVLKKNKNTGPAGDAGDVIVFDDSDFESDEFDSEFESSGDEKEVLPVPKKQRAVSHLGGQGAQNPQIPHSAPLIKPPRNPVVAKRVQLVPVAVRGQAPAGIVEKKKHPETTTQGAVVADVICPRLCPLP